MIKKLLLLICFSFFSLFAVIIAVGGKMEDSIVKEESVDLSCIKISATQEIITNGDYKSKCVVKIENTTGQTYSGTVNVHIMEGEKVGKRDTLIVDELLPGKTTLRVVKHKRIATNVKGEVEGKLY